MSLVDTAIVNLQDKNKKILASYLASRVLNMQTDIASHKADIAKMEARIDKFRNVNFASKEEVSEVFSTGYGLGMIEVDNMQYKVQDLISTLS